MQKLNRREFLQLSGLGAAMTALAACQPLLDESASPTVASISPLVDPANYDDEWMLQRTLQRLTFGPTAEEVSYARAIGIDNWIDEQLAPESINDNQMDAILAPFTTLNLAPSELRDYEPPNQALVDLTAATLLRALHSRRQLYELTVDFWTNHFNIYYRKGLVRALKSKDDREVIRPHALSSFADLLHASAKSPAMLFYLDNASSTADRPNENYARELLELHTLGVDGGYNQLDVQEVARAFTGWTMSGGNRRVPGEFGEFAYLERNHDSGEKRILGHTLPAGGGLEEGEQVLDWLVEHPSTAEFISFKLAQRFVADQPPEPLVAAAAGTFSATGGDITQVLSTILHSDEFKASLGGKVKRPLEVFISTLRSTQVEVGANVGRVGGAQPGRGRRNGASLGQHLTYMGQPLFLWEFPDGYPDSADAWISTNGTLARWNFALALAFDETGQTSIDWPALAEGAGDHSAAIDALSLRLFGGGLPLEARRIILDFATSMELEASLPYLGALLLSSPYFQFR